MLPRRLMMMFLHEGNFVMNVLQKLFAKRRDAVQQTETNWQTLVAGVADGTLTDENEVDAVLTKLGRTPEQLESAIDLHRRVVAAQELIDSDVDTQTELGFLSAESERLKRELDASIAGLKTKHNEDMAGLQQRTGELSQRALRIADAKVFIMQQPKPIDVAKRLTELKIRDAAELQKIMDESSTMEAYRCSGALTQERREKSMAIIAAAEERRKEIQAEASAVEWGTGT
jgi:hypothetical protein